MTAAVGRLQVLGHERNGDGVLACGKATGLAGRCRTFRVVNALGMVVWGSSGRRSNGRPVQIVARRRGNPVSPAATVIHIFTALLIHSCAGV